MRKANIVTSLIFIAASVYIVVQALGMEYMDKDGVPGPGFVPLWTGALIGFLALLMLYMNTVGNRPDSTKKQVFGRQFVKNVAKLLGSSVVAMALVPVLGMLPCIGILTGYLSYVLGTKNLKTNILMAVITPIAFWAVFTYALEVRFPAGLLGF
ncbi:MAG: tripartite tricarboxylate transporter TctB family protein [Negativicutes bacterium]|nr:tripartite tricarboxylate transporter TctB family protein [Negativicutes bacterium]